VWTHENQKGKTSASKPTRTSARAAQAGAVFGNAATLALLKRTRRQPAGAEAKDSL
jgi:hypothetical protein